MINSISGEPERLEHVLPLVAEHQCPVIVLALEAGMDSAIMDPSSPGIAPLLFAAEAVLGRDRFCNKYNRAYRRGKLNAV